MSKDEPDKLPSEDRSQLETQSNLILDSDGSPIPEGSQNQIGHYQIVRKLGEGGMGEVYQAEQLEPVRRKVALKLIKRGMDSKEALSRFELERQSLALMKHANIAQIFDGGVSEQGRLYFVMEYVGGIPINKYCDNGCLNTRQRLELFIQVCEGIQHAHQKGIIHRDIKPSNILVEVQDEKPVPKVIDFGVAKATSAESGDKTASTQIGQIVGTLKYMSPEQVSGVDIDTRTDVYSLGVLLYELLVGVHPVVGRPRLDEKEQPRPMGVEEILRRIREQDPSRPSTQVSTLGESAEQVARERGTDPKTLARELRGDLDWILVKALEKDRARRYGSPSELAADAVRHLRNEPIEARPPSTIYRVGKFVRRHRVGVAAAGVVLVALLAGITGTTIGLIRAVRAEKTASEEAENARQVSNFLVGLFEVSDPSEARGNTITAREILDRGVEKIEGELEDQPTVKAQMMYTMGRVYQSLSLYEQAQPLLEKALEITRNDPGQNRMAVSNSLLQLASLYRQQAKYDEALPLTEEAVAIREEIFGQEHQDVAAALINLGRHLRLTGDYEKARVHLERALAIQEKELGPEHLGVAAALVDLGWLFNLMSEYEKAIEIYERALSIYENKLPEDHPTIASTMHDLGVLHNNIGDHIKARAFLEGALAIKEKVYEPDHPQLAISLDSLGTTLWYMSEYTEAKLYYERALAIREKVHGPKHPDVARSLNNLALLLRYLGAHNKALPLYRRALAIKEETLGPDHPDVALALTNLAYLLSTLTGDINEVSGLLERALAIREKILGPEHPEVADTLLAFAQAYEREGAYDQARLFYRRALAIKVKLFGDEHRDVAILMRNFADFEIINGNYDEARRLLEHALTIREKAFGTEHRDLSVILQGLGDLERINGNYTQAQALYERAMRIEEKITGSSYDRFYILDGMARIHLARNEFPDARLLFGRAIETLTKERGENNPSIAFHKACHHALLDERDQAIHFLRRAIELGFIMPHQITQASDLASLHADPEFEAIVAEAKKRFTEE